MRASSERDMIAQKVSPRALNFVSDFLFERNFSAPPC
jgi:hypothetical protein